MRTMRRITGAVVGGLMMVAAATGLGGCNNAMKDQNAALTQENQELRDRNAQLESSLQAAEAARAQAEIRTADFGGAGTSGRRAGGGGGADWSGIDVHQRGNDVVVAVAGDVLFDSGQVTLKPSAKRTLDKIASNLKSKYSGNRVRVEGYTDSDPIKKSKFPSNEALSRKRAEVVEDYLISKGVNRNAITAVGMGSASPKRTKQESRRVEIVILDDGN